MTSITFPFLVGVPGPDRKIPFKDAEFRFNSKSTRALEKAAGVGVSVLLERGQSVLLLGMLVCYGLRWNDSKMTEDEAINLVDDFIDAGGDIAKLQKAMFDGLSNSGVYGKPVQMNETGDGPLAPAVTH